MLTCWAMKTASAHAEMDRVLAAFADREMALRRLKIKHSMAMDVLEKKRASIAETDKNLLALTEQVSGLREQNQDHADKQHTLEKALAHVKEQRETFSRDREQRQIEHEQVWRSVHTQ